MRTDLSGSISHRYCSVGVVQYRHPSSLRLSGQASFMSSNKSPIFSAQHIHFVGIKGVGMTALALLAKDLGIKITGSDTEEVFVTDETLKKHGISWVTGFDPVNVEDRPDLVITTGAHGGFENPEVVAAKELKIPVLSHAEALGEFAKGKDLITVAGVGGKTTTASMVATLLDSAGKKPSFAVGVGNINALYTPGRYDKEGTEFVTEADEFAISPGIDNRPRFTYQNPRILIVPNIEHDHPDIYPTFEDTKRVFLEFMGSVPKDGLLIACIDNENVRELIKKVNVPIQTYGFSPESDWRIENLEFSNEEARFVVANNNKKQEYTLRVPGKFNVLNATAAIIAGEFLGLTGSDLVKGVKAYTGCKRRIEKVGEIRTANANLAADAVNRITVWDDYAHHPTEIRAALSALRDWYPNRPITAVFQPHTYSRTKALFSEFAQSFGVANKVVIMDIYSSARETDTLGVNSEKLALVLSKHHNDVHYTGGQESTIKFLIQNSKKGDVIVTLGAGDIFHLYKELLEKL